MKKRITLSDMHSYDLENEECFTRSIEMSVDGLVSGGRVLQFWRDVDLYGLEEAMLYLQNEVDNGHLDLMQLQKEVKEFVALIKANQAPKPWGMRNLY